MDHTLTDLTVILDRSGSMQAIREAMEESLDSLIQRQAQQEGRLRVSLVQFDDEMENVFVALAAGDVPPTRIIPRNSTALLDALGLTIDAVGRRLAAMHEAERPGCVVVVVVTDGAENASSRHSWQDVQQRISRQSRTYGWQFIFLGANLDAIATASRLGIAAGDALQVEYDTAGVDDAMNALGRGLAGKRQHLACQLPGAPPAAFNAKDRRKPRR